MISLSQFILAADHIPFTLMGLSLGEHSSVLRSSFVWPFQFPFSPLSKSQSELSHLFLSMAFLHRFSDLYSFHKSYSSQVSIYLTLGTSYRCTRGISLNATV